MKLNRSLMHSSSFAYEKAVIFVGFLVGFISVLCIGNYYRAKRAMERQRQRRLARLVQNDGGTHHSNNSVSSSIYSDSEQQSLLPSNGRGKHPSGMKGPTNQYSAHEMQKYNNQLTQRTQIHQQPQQNFSQKFQNERDSMPNDDLISV